MLPAPYTTPHAVVALWCLAVAVGSCLVIDRQFGHVPLRAVPGRLCRRFVVDLRGGRPWSTYWGFLLAWGLWMCVLHFGGLEFGLYGRFGWWDLMTHFLSGLGVAGILLVGLREIIVGDPTLPWVLLALLAIGAGFEVYEYVFRSFWQAWTPRTYAWDTLTDLLMGCLGGGVGLAWYRVLIGTPSDRSTESHHAHRGD